KTPVTMISRFLFRFAALAIMILPALQMRADDNKLILGNCYNNAAVAYKSVSTTSRVGFAFSYPAERMEAYKGCGITEICFHISYLADMKPVRVFVTKAPDAAPLFETQVEPTATGWISIRPETPLTIDGSRLYVGYETEGVRLLSYGNNLFPGCEDWMLANGTWSRLAANCSPAVYCVVSGAGVPDSEIRLTHLLMPRYGRVGEKLHYEGTFVNMGCGEVNSLELTWHLGDETYVETVPTAAVASRATGSFATDNVVIATESDRDVWLEVTGVNGKADAVPYDNVSRHTMTTCRSSFTPRKMLLEVFSTELCSNCPTSHKQIERILGDKSDVIELCHHAGFYSDGFTIDESKEYEWFYNEARLFAPAVMFDRRVVDDNYPSVYADGVAPVKPTGTVLAALYGECTGIPALVSIDITPSLDTETRELKLHVAGKSLLPSTAANPCLYVFISEDSLFTETQAGASGNFYHRYSARRSLTPTWGKAVDVENGFEEYFETELPDSWNLDNLRVVAFVANYDAEDKKGCDVLNAAEVELKTLLPSSVASAHKETLPLVVYSDGRLIAPRGFDELSVCDLTGRLVSRHSDVHERTVVPSLPAGAYVVSVRKGAESSRIKVILR
ncbi:MAG: Omp28-related outer membrane protein, partial [Prevotella sp.]